MAGTFRTRNMHKQTYAVSPEGVSIFCLKVFDVQ